MKMKRGRVWVDMGPMSVLQTHHITGSPVLGEAPVQVKHGNSRLEECRRGHPFSEENTYTRKDGIRRCRTCTTVRMTAWRLARAA